MNLSLIRFFVKQFEENDGRCGTTGRLSVQLSFKLVKQVLMFAGFTFCSMTLAQVSVPPIPAYWTGWDAVTHYSSEAAACVGSMITRNSTCCAANPITAFTSMSGKECYGDETILSNGSTYSNIHYADATAVAAHCTDGYTLSGSNCIANSQPVLAVNVGPSACPVTKGNPINIGIGNKYQMESDYGIADDASLGFYRQYNSINPIATGSIGVNWHTNFDRALQVISGSSLTTAIVSRPNGKSLFFTYINGTWASNSDINDLLVQTTGPSNTFTGWRYTVGLDHSVESYDATGRLLSITSRAGVILSLTYDANVRLSKVTDSFGRRLTFTYNSANNIATMTDPANGVYTYSYDSNNNLTSVTYPDQGVRTYVYENASFPNSLTGIVDENNKRFATWTYDSTGRAITSEHAGGVEKYTISYTTDGTGKPVSSTVIDPLNSIGTTNISTVVGTVKSAGDSQPSGSGCSAASNAITYDSNGNIASRTDFNGNKTTYIYDLARNLETSRTEASGTAQARTITTQWHSTYRLPAVIAEPLRKTSYSYDTSGNLLNKTVQATSDVNGSQGFSAQTTGTPRTWSYTYNNVGQVLTAIGPRTDVVDKTTYSYDPATGNLLTITNAAGQVTTLSNYDLNGKVGTITDANGMTTNLSYYPRGWLHTKSISSGGSTQTTNYFYDGVGQLINVNLPDNSTITYSYDPAHRLTDISDSLGNTIHYTLDAMGNRISEQVKDPNSTLTRQTTRVFDALNRLQQVTGAVQ